MPYYDNEEDDTGTADDDDPELSDASDMDDPDDDEAETTPCLHCRRPIYESADRCPHCGGYLSDENAPHRRPYWIVAGVVVCLIVIILTWVL